MLEADWLIAVTCLENTWFILPPVFRSVGHGNQDLKIILVPSFPVIFAIISNFYFLIWFDAVFMIPHQMLIICIQNFRINRTYNTKWPITNAT